MVFELPESPFRKAFGGGRLIGYQYTRIALHDEFEVFRIIFPDSKTMIQHVVDVLHHDLFQEFEIHDHAFLSVIFSSDHGTFYGSDNHTPMAVQLVAERIAVGQRMSVIDFDFA